MNDPKMTDINKSDEPENVEQDPIEDPEHVAETELPDSGQDADTSTDQEVSVEELQMKIAVLCEALESAKDKSLRAQAEVENIRRRTSNEQINIRKYAIEGFASELLAVKDSLDLAEQVELSEDNKDVIGKMQEGLSLTLRQLQTVFEKFSIEIIAPEKGEKLNPEMHQAMTVQPSDEVEPNCVLEIIQKGYKLHDRLLRPAMVIIARKTEQKNNETE